MATAKELHDANLATEAAQAEAMAAREALESATAELNALRDAPRVSREQESRAADVIHEEYDDDWEEPSLLDTKHIPARPGFVQRWVRTELNGQPDAGNISRKFNQGWSPRTADSVSKASHVPFIDHGQYGQVIGIQGMILMERPEKIHERHAARNKRATNDQMRSVNESIYKAHEPGSKMHVKNESTSQVHKGQPRIADD